MSGSLSLYRFTPSPRLPDWQTVACRNRNGARKHYRIRPLGASTDMATRLMPLAIRLGASKTRETPNREIYLAIGVGPDTESDHIYVLGLLKEPRGPTLLHDQCWPLEEFETFRDVTPRPDNP